MDDFFTSFASTGAYDLLRTAIRNVDRLCHYESYERDVKILIERLDILEKHRKELMTKVDSAKQMGDEIHGNVTEWLSETNKALSENRAKAKRASQDIIEFVRHPEWMIDEATLSSITMAIDDMINYCVEFYHRISYPCFLDKNYMAFEARRPIWEGVMKKLRDPNVKIIGLHGMGGIGKTTLAKQIARQAKKEANLFHKVIMSSALSETPKYADIQCEIAKGLGIKFDNHETQLTKATRLLEELSKQVKVLIILDDIWEQINLVDIGIHFGDDQKGCKILFTSRRQGLYYDMQVVEFALNSLEDEESEKLFRKVVGKTLDNNPDCESLVSGLVKECGGVPIVINVVASALQRGSSSKWTNYLDEMQKSALENIDGMESNVIQSIKRSYNFLENKEAQSLLLLCSTFGEDELISDDDLLMYWVGRPLLKNVNKFEVNELKDARDKVRTLIDILRKNSLLLPSDKSESHNTYHWVKLHDVIRDALKSIAVEKGLFSLRYYGEMAEENLKDSLAMSFNYDANELPCPNLVFLHRLASFSRSSRRCLSDCFFEETKKLRVLKLQDVYLRSPPSSFSCLVGTLQTLCLNDCDLEDTAFLGSFKNLKCLDLSWSSFEKLSKQVGQLTRLQLLKLDDCRYLKVIEPDVISSLINLEELYMRNVVKVWDNVSLTELKKLPRLSTLCITIANDNLLSKDLFTWQMKTYEIIVGQFFYIWDSEDKRYSRVLQLTLDEANLMKECGIDKLISGCQALLLRGCNARYIVNSALECNHRVFQNLEEMKLVGLTNLQNICDGEFAADSFRKLKVVEVSQCHSLKNIFPVSNIGQLEKIEVEWCEMMEEIVFQRREDGTHQKIEFMKLQNLEIKNSPNLVRFCKVEREHNIPSSSSSLETLPFFMEEVSFPNLENLYLKSLEKVEMIWPDQVFPMQNLKYLTIQDCPTVKYLFPFALARSLVQLTTLSIMSCKNMEEILVIKETGEEGSRNETILLSNLKSFSDSLKRLKLRDCPKLTSFNNSCTNEFEQVEEPFFNEKVSFASMEKLELIECDSVKMIWPNQLEEVSYMQNFKKINLSKCGNLEYICSLAMARSLVQLKKLRVESCETIQEVLATKEAEEEGSRNETISLPNLEILRLYSLSNLKSFSGGKCLAIKYPSLKLLAIEKCPRLKTFHRNCISSEFEKAEEPLFNEKVSFPNSEELYFRSLEEKEFGPNQDPKILTIYMDCPAVKYLFDFAFARSLEQLRKLSIANLETMEEIFVIKEAGEEGSRQKITLFPKLENIIIRSLSKLKSFSGGGKYLTIECPSLKSLTIWTCPRLKTFHKSCTNEFEQVEEPFFNEKVSFASMEELELINCNSIQMIWPNQLEEVSYMHMQNFKKISLWMCENLEYICSFEMARSLVQLKELHVHSCETIQEVLVINEAEEGNLNETILFPKLENIDLWSLSNLRSFSGEKCLTMEYPSLKSLTIRKCPRLKTFHKNCTNQFEQVEEPFFNEKVLFSRLERLNLRDCDSMQMIWPNQLEEVYYMQNLKKLILENCGNLKYIFSSAMARRLVQLEEVHVESCGNIQEVLVIKEAEEEGSLNKTIMFPKLTRIELDSLSNFISFSGGKCLAIEYPSLKSLTISRCPRLKTFHKNCTNKFEQVEEPFFNEKVSFASMEELDLSNCNFVQMIWPIQLEEVSYMKNLKKLKLENYGNLEYICSLAMARSMVQLTELHIESCETIQEVFVTKEAEEEGSLSSGKCFAIECPSLNSLAIIKCPRLKTFHRSCTNSEFEKAEELLFNEKVGLFNLEDQRWKCLLMSPFVSFQNLVEIRIYGCDTLVNLMDCSTAKSLEQLKTMIIISCDQMTQVIMDEEGEMVFPQLKTLVLLRLPKLESFNCGNSVVDFPSLEEVAVNECPNMENFSRGAVITTRLRKIDTKLRDGSKFISCLWRYRASEFVEEVWEGDLKTSVRMIWEKHNVSKEKNYEDHVSSSSSPIPSFEEVASTQKD